MDLVHGHAPSLSVAAGATAHVRAALEVARAAEPCGYLLGRRTQHGVEVLEAVNGRNVHPAPRAGFRLAPVEHLEVRRRARTRGLRVVGTWHGHLHGPAVPGRADRRTLATPGLGCMLIAARHNDGTPHVRAYVAQDGGVQAWDAVRP